MHTLFLILTCFAGVFTFAFLLAGIVGLQDKQPPQSARGTAFRFLDVIVLSGIGSVVLGFYKNWRTQRESRTMIYAGLFALTAFLIFGYLAIQTG